MSITSVQAWQAFGSGTSVNITFSQTATLDNLLMTFMTKDDDVLATGPAGWTQAYGFTSNGQIAMQCWWKISDGTETGLTITGDSEVYAVYGLEVTGNDPTDPILGLATTTTGTNAQPNVQLSTTLSQGVPAFYAGHIGVDRNRTFTGWQSPTGIEPPEFFRHEGAGAGDVSQLVHGVFYTPNVPIMNRGYNISAADEWGTKGIYVTPVLATPVISLPTGTPQTISASASQIIDAGFTTDVAQGEAFWYLSSSSTPPSVTDLKAGTGSIQDGSQTVSATGALTFATITGLSPNTSYFLHFLHENISKNSNILSINVSTPPFVVSLTFFDFTQIYYTGSQCRYYTDYQNVGTAYAVVTASATTPTAADIIANTVPGGLHRAIDSSWGTGNPNLIFNTFITNNPNIVHNTDHWVHAVVDDPGNGAQSDVITSPMFTTLHRWEPSNWTILEARLDEIDIQFDVTINDSTDPIIYVHLYETSAPLDAQEMYNLRGTAAYYNAFEPAVQDGVFQFTATGLSPLTTYYVHVYWYDQQNGDYNTRVYWPVQSPALSAITALSVERLEMRTKGGPVLLGGLQWQFVRFGLPGRFVNCFTEELEFTGNPATLDKAREVNTITEVLLLDENQANVSVGGQDLTVNGITEVLRLTTNQGFVGQGQTAFGQTEVLELTTNPATVTKDATVVGSTEELLMTVNQGEVIQNIFRIVNTVTEQLIVTVNPLDDLFRGKNRNVDVPTVPLQWASNAADIQRDREIATPGGNQFLLDVNDGFVGQGQTAFGVTETLVKTTNKATILRDREVHTDPEAEIKILWVSKATIGRGRTIRCETEKLVCTARDQKATIFRGVSLRPDTEELVLTTNQATIGRGVTVLGSTEQIVLNTANAFVGKSTDRLVTGNTEELQLQTNPATIDQGRNVQGTTEELILTVNRARVYQVFTSVGGGLEFGDRVGVEVISTGISVRVLSPDPDDATVITPSTVDFSGCC